MMNKLKTMDRGMLIYLCITALTALALGFSNDVISNYFKDAYNATAFQRGLIEFPRELPGVMVIFVVAALSFLPDIRISMLAQILSVIGITVLGFFTPSFSVMLVFIFINSLGMHLFMPLQDSIGMSLIKEGNLGRTMGLFKGVTTAFTMLSSLLVFIGFRVGFFSFTTQTKWIFIWAAIFSFIVFLLLILLERSVHQNIKSNKKVKFIFRKEYKYYYTLVVMFGVQKQIMMVYGPWVLIELVGKKADTLAILGMIGAFIGIFFIPTIGHLLDKFGIKAILYADALSFIGVYLVYGLLSAGFYSGKLAAYGLPVLFAYILFVVDKMSNQLGMVRAIYLRSIAVDPADVTPTLSLGLSVDHIVSITCAFLGGIIWTKWGPQYIFFLAAALSCVNLYVAFKVKNVERG